MLLVRSLSPKYTLGVQVIVRRPDGWILTVRQPYRALPFLPGGLLKRGESVLSAARRELREETSLDLPVVDLGHVQVRPQSRWATFYALAEVDDAGVAAARADSAEVTALIWVDPTALPAVDPAVHAALDHVRRAPVALGRPSPSGRSQPEAVVRRTSEGPG